MKYGMTGLLLIVVGAGYSALIHAEDSSFETDKQKFSYTIGFQIGQSLKEDGLDIDVDALGKAISDVMAGAAPRLSMEEMQTAIQSFQTEQMERLGAVAEENLREGRNFLEENKQRSGVVERESGIQYEIIEEGDGKRPGPQDTVVVNYRGELLDGTEFDSTFRRGEPASFPVDAVIPGWQEVLPLMKEGAVWKVFIPPEHAYGERGAGQDIGPNATLIFDIELLSVE